MKTSFFLDNLQREVLGALVQAGALPGRPFKSLGRTIGSAVSEERAAAAVVAACKLAAPWHLNLPLIEGHGNFGSPDRLPADANHLEARLTPLGLLALESDFAASLLGLINGDLYEGGGRPGFAPGPVLKTIAEASRGSLSGSGLCAAVGPPSHPSDCRVEGDFESLCGGSKCTLAYKARTDVSGQDIVITHLPPGCGSIGLATDLKALLRTAEGAQMLGGTRASTTNESGPHDRVVVRVGKKVDVRELAAWLEVHSPVRVSIRCRLPSSLADLVGTFVDWHGRDVELERFKECIQGTP